MLHTSIDHQFNLLKELLEKLENDQYIYKSQMIGGFSIGQHMRHIIELFQALDTGYKYSSVDYDKRKRDERIEIDRNIAIAALHHLQWNLQKPDKELQMIFLGPEYATIPIKTYYNRELAYNIEHAIHHMSLIRVALREQDLDLVPAEFGFAYSTLRKMEMSCAQ